MAKKVLKQLLLVILALSILMVGTTAALAEGTGNQKMTVCLISPSEYDFETFQWMFRNSNSSANVTNSFENPRDENEIMWLLVIGQEPGRELILPDPLPQEIFFVNCVVTEKPIYDVEPVIPIWIDYIVELVHQGVTVHLYANEPIEPYDFFTGEVNRATFEALEEMANDPENSRFSKSEEDKNLFVVSFEDETCGYISVLTAGRSNSILVNYAIKDFVAAVEAFEKGQ